MLSEEALAFYRHNPIEIRVSAVLETSGPNPLTDDLLGVYLCGEQDSFAYWNFRPGAEAERGPAIGMLRSFPLILFGAARCCTWLGRVGVTPIVAADPALAAFVLDPNQPLDLNALSTKYLERPFESLAGELHEEGIIQRSSGELLLDSLGPMATVIKQLHQKLRTLPDWAEPVYAQELSLVPVIVGMELHGIAVDAPSLTKIVHALEEKSVGLEVQLDALGPPSID